MGIRPNILTLITKVWERIQKAWERQGLGWLLGGAAVIFVLYWFYKPPPSSRALIAMAVAAALTAMRTMKWSEKWLWTVIFICFALIEIKAENRDRDVQNKVFTEIGNGIKASIQQNTAHFDETMQRLGDVNTKLSVVQFTLQGSDRSDLGPKERQQITMEVAAYLKNGQSSNPTNFSNQSLSVFANEIAYQMVALYPSWVSKKENVTESFAHQFLWPLGKTIAEKNILAEEEKAETEALRSNLESEIRRLLLDASVACKAMLQRVPNRPSDKTLLNRLQTASQDFQTTASDEDLVEYAKELRDLAKRVSP